MASSDIETETRRWAKPLMRMGYAGRGVVYAAVGMLTMLSAWQGGSGEGTQSALASVRAMPFGPIVIYAIALALLAYAVWRIADAFLDFDKYGSDAHGIAARAAIGVVGLIHIGLAVAAFTVAAGRTGGDGESGVDAMTQSVLSLPFGRWLVGLAGIATVGAGLYFFKRAWSEDYRDKLVANRVTERLNPLMRFGVFAHGVVIALIGAFLIVAAWRFDASEAGGMAQAFDSIRDFTAGRLLLGATGLGFVGFALTCFVSAAYRIMPARVRKDDDRRLLSGRRAGETVGG